MSRILLSATALLLVSTGLASARDLVPGSDLGVRSAQAAADHSVITGSTGARGSVATSYGYQRGQTVRFESYRPAERSGERAAPPAAASDLEQAIVPGSDSF